MGIVARTHSFEVFRSCMKHDSDGALLITRDIPKESKIILVVEVIGEQSILHFSSNKEEGTYTWLYYLLKSQGHKVLVYFVIPTAWPNAAQRLRDLANCHPALGELQSENCIIVQEEAHAECDFVPYAIQSWLANGHVRQVCYSSECTAQFVMLPQGNANYSQSAIPPQQQRHENQVIPNNFRHPPSYS